VNEKMNTTEIVDKLPPWSIFFLTAILLLLAFEAGLRLGKFIQLRWPDKYEAGVGTKVGAALTILALLLAFVINFSITIFNERRQLVVSEANAIGTAYLRAGYLSEPYKTESRRLIRDYLNLRLEVIDKVKGEGAITHSVQIQDELWRTAEEMAIDTPTPTIALYISSLNDIIDLDTERLNAEIGFRVPLPIIAGLLGVCVMTMLLLGINDGYHERSNRIALLVLVIILAGIFLLFIGLDRSNSGLIRIPVKPLIDLQLRLSTLP
jgi:hypothetical protein